MGIPEQGSGNHFDSEVLTAFKEIAESIYRNLSGREDTQLEQELEQLTQRYFSAEQGFLS